MSNHNQEPTHKLPSYRPCSYRACVGKQSHCLMSSTPEEPCWGQVGIYDSDPYDVHTCEGHANLCSLGEYEHSDRPEDVQPDAVQQACLPERPD